MTRLAEPGLFHPFCQFRPGVSPNRAGVSDLLGTGTISAPEREGFGSLLELTTGGASPIMLPNGERRRFLDDGDEIILRARAHADGFTPIGFGECRAIILPAR